jgi:molecular chaperone HscB
MDFDFSRNYFELFSLDQSFVIDDNQLMGCYQQLQSQYHPDRFIDGDDQQKRIAMQATTFINEAYKTMRDDQSRARYMLELQGVAFDEEQDTTQDMEFLMAQMSLREQIDEVDSKDDPLESLDTLESQSRKDKKKLIEAFQNHYLEQDWSEAKEAVLKLQFFSRLQQQINQKQEMLEDKLI